MPFVNNASITQKQIAYHCVNYAFKKKNHNVATQHSSEKTLKYNTKLKH